MGRAVNLPERGGQTRCGKENIRNESSDEENHSLAPPPTAPAKSVKIRSATTAIESKIENIWHAR